MKRIAIALVLCAVLAVAYYSRTTPAQENPDADSGIASMNAAQVVQAAAENPSTDRAGLLRERATIILRETPGTLAAGEIVSLVELAGSLLVSTERASIQRALEARLAASSRFEDFQGGLTTLRRLGASLRDRSLLAKTWSEGNDGSRLDAAQMISLLRMITEDSLGSDLKADLVYVGALSVSAPGPRVFSLGTIDLRELTSEGRIDFQATLEVGGEIALETTATSEWITASKKIEFPENTEVPLKLSVKYERRRGPHDNRKPLVAILQWKGENETGWTPIPQEAFAGTVTLEGAMSSRDRNWALTTRVGAIDQTWQTRGELSGDVRGEAAKIAGALWSQLAFQDIENREGAQRFALAARIAAGLVDSKSRINLIEEILALPQPLQYFDPSTVQDLYQACGRDSPRTFVEVLGRWGQFNRDIEPDLNWNFKGANRDSYRYLADDAIGVAAYRRELTDFLRSDDGKCCLPVAYMLCYSHLRAGDYGSWVSFLDDQIKQASPLTKTNWMIARAQAEEVKYAATSQPNIIGHESSLAGRQWLEEAELVVESAAEKDRLRHELVARMISCRTGKELDAFIAGFDSRGGSPRGQQWKAAASQIGEERQAFAKKSKEAAFAGLDQHLRELGITISGQ